MAAFAVVFGIFWAIMMAAGQVGGDAGLGIFGFGMILATAVAVVLGALVQAGILRAALEVTYGRPVDIKTFFTFTDLGKVLLAALLVGLLGAVPIIGLVLAFFAQFTLLFVLDKGLSPIDALKASFALVNQNLGTVVVLFIGVYVAYFVGSLACGVGILVAMPVALIATTYVYRRLLGETVAA